MEHFEHYSETDHTRTQNGNMMQIMLAERNGIPLEVFIAEHAKDFRVFADNHPELLDKFLTNPDEVLAEAEKVIYH